MSADDANNAPETMVRLDNVQGAQNTEMPPPPQATAIGISPEQQARIPQRKPEQASKGKKETAGGGIGGAVVGIILLLLIAGAAIFFIAPVITTPTNSVVTYTSTIPGPKTVGCNVISTPGTYYVSSPAKYRNLSGACLYINASNVNVVCENVRIEGSGPFGSVPPFTYGAEFNGGSNDSIRGCDISNFSYGIMAIGADNLTIKNDNVSVNYVSDIYLNRSSGSEINNNYISRAESTQGGVYLSKGSTNSRISNNTIQFNTFYGVMINSSHNTFIDNHVNGTPTSFYCSLNNSFPTSSYAHGNVCYNDTGCGFLECFGNNIPADISDIVLGSSINGCGSINSPGSYALEGNIDMANFVNVGSLSANGRSVPCIDIKADNVNLNCNNFTISNATVGLEAAHATGLTLNNCKFINSTVGISLSSVTVAHMGNLTFMHDRNSFLISNSSALFVTNLKAVNNIFGVYLLSSQDIEMNDFNISRNVWGLYLNNSIRDVFNSGTAFNNSELDVYSSPNYVNASDETMESTNCGTTNAQWATCNQHESASLGYSVISSCQGINKFGDYVLNGELLAGNNCIDIKASNVDLNCKGNAIQPLQRAYGYAIAIGNVTNVTVQNCRLASYGTGLEAYNVSVLNLSNLDVLNSNQGIILTRITRSDILNNTVNGSTNSDMLLNGINYSLIKDNNLKYSSASGTSGMLLNDSQYNIVINNTGASNYFGMNITGLSRNNTVLYNSFNYSAGSDYVCAPQDSGLLAERGKIDYGLTKGTCSWMAVIAKLNQEISCNAALSAGAYVLTNDWLYKYNSTCFNIYSSGSTINCNGHTVVATDGGTFARFMNSKDSKLENCYLEGFITPIIAVNASVDIVNDTVIMNATSIFHRGAYAINITGTDSSTISLDNVSSVLNGIRLANATGTALQHDTVNANGTAYEISNTVGTEVDFDTAGPKSTVGIELLNSTFGTFQNDNFMGSKGLVCVGTSNASANNLDQGGNSCSLNSGCEWVSKSAKTC